MLYYIIYIIITILCLFFIKKNFISKIIFFLSSVLLFSLRDPSVGSDTYSYYEIFSNINQFTIFNPVIEPGYIIFNKLIHIFTSNFTLYLIVYSSIFLSIWLISIEKNIKFNKDIAYLSFLSFPGYLYSFNVARQALAMAICVYSMKFLFKNKPIHFIILILLAISIHYSSLIFLLVLLIKRLSKFPIFLAISSFMIFYFVGQVIIKYSSNFYERYNSYTNNLNNITGIYLIVFLILQLMLFIYFFKRFFSNCEKYKTYLSIFSFGVGMFIAMKLQKIPDEGPIRMCTYFLVFNIFLYPYIFIPIRDQQNLILIKYLFYCLCIFMFFNTVLSNVGGILNYKLNSSLRIF